MGGKKNGRSQGGSQRIPIQNTPSWFSRNKVLIGLLVLVLGLAIERFYFSKRSSSKGDVSYNSPYERPNQDKPWSEEVQGESLQGPSGKLKGTFRTRTWLSSHEDHPNPNIRNLPRGSLKKWSSEHPLGHMGTGVELGHLDSQARELREKMFKTHYFDEFVSELVPLDRELPDWRGQWCKDTYDNQVENLEPTTVIICFHNEAMSTLLRTIHSVVKRSPKSLVKEILLIDDNSSLENLGDPLKKYIDKVFPDLVRIIRLKERHGLMRSRMVGIKESKGPVLTFLDSHVEASKGWLEPLLYRLKENPKLIISPVIDAINDTTFFYNFIQKDLYGLMNWNMVFEWRELSPQDRLKKVNIWAPHDNPIMAGGLFSIRKDWFETLGFYDEGMSVWGGENYELSFKAWTCGGSIEISPCSRVGHVYRSSSPYRVTPHDINKNGLRVAEVWMDEYKYLFFDRLGNYGAKSDNRLLEFGNVAERKNLRKKLNCKSFKWFLDNIGQLQLPYHELIGAGEIRNPMSDLCLDQNDRTEFIGTPVVLRSCHGLGGNQYWWMNRNRFILRDYTCLGISNSIVVISDCRVSGSWSYDHKKKTIRHSTGHCMVVKSSGNEIYVGAEKCNSEDEKQYWEFTKYNKHGIKYHDLL